MQGILNVVQNCFLIAALHILLELRTQCRITGGDLLQDVIILDGRERPGGG